MNQSKAEIREEIIRLSKGVDVFVCPPEKVKVKYSVYTGSNKRGGRQQDSKGWNFNPVAGARI